jgi:arylamine N-acetyltransferase
LADPVRGGYCFELNGAFHWLLKKLGYQVLHILYNAKKKEAGPDSLDNKGGKKVPSFY